MNGWHGGPAFVPADEYLDARTRAWSDGQRRLWLDAEREGGVRYDPLTRHVSVAPQHTTIWTALALHPVVGRPIKPRRSP